MVSLFLLRKGSIDDYKIKIVEMRADGILDIIKS